jgi:hypothetical protein
MKNWLSKQAFKKLAAELRRAEGRQFERAALPYFRLVFGDVRQAPPRLDRLGIDLCLGEETPFDLVVQCKSSVLRLALPEQLAAAKESLDAFRESGQRTNDMFSFSTAKKRRSNTVAPSRPASAILRRWEWPEGPKSGAITIF